jgi:hypothetical protein
MHQHAGAGGVQRLLAGGSFRTQDGHQGSQQDGRYDETGGKEGERLRPWHGVARADEAGRPQNDEGGGDEPLDALHGGRLPG